MSTLFFFSQASHLAYRYRYLPSQMHILRFFLAFAFIILLLTLFTLFQIPGEKKNCSVDFSNNVPAVARALCNQGSGRGRTSISRDVCMCTCGTCARARMRCCTCNCVVPSKRSTYHLFTKAQFFFSFFFLLNITRLRLNSNLCSKQR